MSKKEEFKSFVSKHPDLINIVETKKHTWQELYEVYDLYGSDETAWSKYLNVNKNDNISSSTSIGELVKLFKNINIESVQKYIDTAQKAIGIVQELTGGAAGASIVSKGPTNPRPINKIFED